MALDRVDGERMETIKIMEKCTKGLSESLARLYALDDILWPFSV